MIGRYAYAPNRLYVLWRLVRILILRSYMRVNNLNADRLYIHFSINLQIIPVWRTETYILYKFRIQNLLSERIYFYAKIKVKA
jgi:hypothetical protein